MASYSSSLSAAAGSGTGSEGDVAVDIGVNAATSVSSSNVSKITSTEAFNEAYACLGMRSDEIMQKGIQAALDLQRVSFFI